MKSIHNAIAKAARLNPLKTEKAAPSWEAIGTKAYEEHWFEAERQLRQG